MSTMLSTSTNSKIINIEIYLISLVGRRKKYIMLNRRPTFRMSSGHRQFYFSKENHMKCGHMRKFCMRCINLGYDKFIVGQC